MAKQGRLMLQVTWEWLGQDLALDIANTVSISDGAEHDLIARVSDYERWAAAEGSALGFDPDERLALGVARSQLLELRPAVRAVIAAAAETRELPPGAVSALNRASRSAPSWVELDPATRRIRSRGRVETAKRLLAAYARAAMALVGNSTAEEIRRCPAPSCGMFYRPGRSDQRWCSAQCGSRARVARHYRAHRESG
jgi:predicted RNA-binding Zn ribbon-like protein